MVTSANVSVTLVSQASVAVACAKLGVPGHSIVDGAGSAAITGAVVSAMLIIWLAVELLPQSSVAVQVRVATCGQVPVIASLNVSVTVGSQASVAVACAKLGVAGH